MEPCGPALPGWPPEAGDRTCSVVHVHPLDLHPDVLGVTEYGRTEAAAAAVPPSKATGR